MNWARRKSSSPSWKAYARKGQESCNYSYRLSKTEQLRSGLHRPFHCCLFSLSHAKSIPYFAKCRVQKERCFLDRLHLEAKLICSTATLVCSLSFGRFSFRDSAMAQSRIIKIMMPDCDSTNLPSLRPSGMLKLSWAHSASSWSAFGGRDVWSSSSADVPSFTYLMMTINSLEKAWKRTSSEKLGKTGPKPLWDSEIFCSEIEFEKKKAKLCFGVSLPVTSGD